MSQDDTNAIVVNMDRGWIVDQGDYFEFIPRGISSKVAFCRIGEVFPSENELCWYEERQLKHVHLGWLFLCGYFSHLKGQKENPSCCVSSCEEVIK